MSHENTLVSPVFPRIALVGNPNCGKTALFNALTHGRAKVGNYPGVTVERKESQIVTAAGITLSILDLPGTYSLVARTLDEGVTRDILMGKATHERSPDILVGVVDAANLERGLGLVLEIQELGKPMILALNMMDLAQSRGLVLDIQILSRELGIPVVPTVATRGKGVEDLVAQVQRLLGTQGLGPAPQKVKTIAERFAEVDRILSLAVTKKAGPTLWTDRIDRVVLHPILGSLILFVVLGVVFQAIFAWAQGPMDWIESGVDTLREFVTQGLGEGPLRSLLVDGIISGVGSIIVFLPQILLLFLFILVLEDSGYMARAAFLMDRLMGKVGLHGRAFIPLLSSYACAVPGIMATRTIEHRRDRLTTILIAPLITCSARLPVYALLIAAFIPNVTVGGWFGLQGIVMLGLYLLGAFIALGVAVIFRRTFFRGPKPALLMELPTYKWPNLKNILIGLLERTQVFIKRAGTVIFTVSVLLWFFISYPLPPAGTVGPAIAYSYAGRVGHWLEPAVRPLGFNWEIALALIPSFTAREVMIGALATVYSVEGNSENRTLSLVDHLSKNWSIATGLSLLVWYMLACQCLSTLAVIRRETNSWRWPVFTLIYMTSLAYFGSFITYHLAMKVGLS